MEYRKLANTDIKLSVICLGSMTWGMQNTEEEGHAQIDFALERGVNFIDTAELYPVPPNLECQGKTETCIGTWLASRKKRDKIFIASKVTGPGEFVKFIRQGPRLNRKHIELAIEASLKRLQTDYIDLYQLHWPERKTNFFGKLGYSPESDEETKKAISIHETLEVLNDLVKAGKIRYIGLSNETPWGLMEFLRLAKEKNMPRVVSIQNPYNLLNRIYEIGLAEMSHREKISLLAYSPLAFGVLSGKYIGGQLPNKSRLQLFGKHYKRYINEVALKATEAYAKIAKKYNLDFAKMSLAFVNSRSFLTSNIIGATTLKQLEHNIDSINLKLDLEILEEILTVHKKYPNPSP